MPAAMIKTIRRNARTYSLKLAGTDTHDDDGYAAESATTSNDIKAHIQPMGYKDLRNVPEGQNTLKWIVLWSEVDIPEKAEVTYGGVVYVIQKTQYWDDGEFYKAAAVHVED